MQIESQCNVGDKTTFSQKQYEDSKRNAIEENIVKREPHFKTAFFNIKKMSKIINFPSRSLKLKDNSKGAFTRSQDFFQFTL